MLLRKLQLKSICTTSQTLACLTKIIYEINKRKIRNQNNASPKDLKFLKTIFASFIEKDFSFRCQLKKSNSAKINIFKNKIISKY